MKLLNSLRARKLNFLFCLLLSHLFIVGAVSGNVCKNVPTKDDWRNCKEHLEPEGFMPICPGTLCEALMIDSVPYHEFCMNKGPYDPIKVFDCCNHEILEWIQALPGYENISLGEIVEACIQLGDPWVLGTCYCCCGGLDSAQTTSSLNSENQNEL